MWSTKSQKKRSLKVLKIECPEYKVPNWLENWDETYKVIIFCCVGWLFKYKTATICYSLLKNKSWRDTYSFWSVLYQATMIVCNHRLIIVVSNAFLVLLILYLCPYRENFKDYLQRYDYKMWQVSSSQRIRWECYHEWCKFIFQNIIIVLYCNRHAFFHVFHVNIIC